MAEFFAECEEITQRVSSNLSALEKGADQDTIDSLYRDMHTMKGSSQLFGFAKLGQIAHAVETSLDPLRTKLIELNPVFVDCLFKCLDLIDRMVSALQKGGDESGFQDAADEMLHRLIDATAQQFGGSYTINKDGLVPPENAKAEQAALAAPQAEPKTDQPKDIAVPAKQHSTPANSSPAPAPKPTPKPSEAAPPSKPVAATKAPPAPKNTKKKSADPEKLAGQPSAAPETVRVQVELLDRLMNLVGELVLVRNQVLQHSTRSEDFEFLNLSQNLDIVTSDLQGEVMKTRMQPIGNVLNKYQRVIRDIAKDLGKKIELTLGGTETELDKTLLEAIKDPLTHIIRNSCDHGVEGPEERLAAGKSEQGHVSIRAYHEGGQIVVEIKDDGRGLNREKLIQKALEKGLITEERAAELTDREAYALIFHAGFSTAQKVSSVSGRGVGMDVVRNNIEKIGGAVDLNSELGQGTTIRLKIPLTLAIVPAMIVRVAGEKFAIPQVKLVELVRVEPGEEHEGQIEFLQGKPVFRLRGNLLPLVRLDEVLDKASLQSAQENNVFELKQNSHSESKIVTPDPSDVVVEEDDGWQVEAEDHRTTNIVVLNGEGHQFGLIVDKILDTADIVVKPLSQFLKSLAVFSGATIMGDGSVALILDVGGISHRARIDSASNKGGDSAFDGSEKVLSSGPADAQDFLLFRVNAPGKYGVPLCLVNRLEEFRRRDIEYSGEQRVVRYRNSILPIISLNEVLGYQEADEKATKLLDDDPIHVVVATKNNQLFGIEVNSISDVTMIDEPLDDSLRDRMGILGNVVLGDEVIVVIDVLGIMDAHISKMAGATSGGSRPAQVVAAPNPVAAAPTRQISILYAEDAPFFRRQVTKVLTGIGIKVHTEDDGALAFKRLQESNPGEFDLLLSDIEMPKMTGFELAEKVREQERFRDLPMVAITTRFRERDQEKGRSVGFNEYLEKMNSDELIATIQSLLNNKESKAS